MKLITPKNAHKLEQMLQDDLRDKGHDIEVSVKVDSVDEAPEPKPDSDPTDATAQLTDWAARIEEQEREVARLELIWNDAKAEAKEAKASYELGVATLRRLVRERNNPQRQLPFGNDEKAKPEEEWRAVLTMDLGIGGAAYVSLAEAGLKTLGAIVDYTAERDLTDIDGIGPAGAEKIRNALDKWWTEHPEFVPTEPEAGDEEEAG